MHKFSIVSYLERKITEEIIELQKKIADETENYNALEFWKPHLTIGSGILVSKKELNQLYKDISLVLSEKSPFNIILVNYGFFTEPDRMIHLKVDKNKRLLDIVSDIENITKKHEIWYPQPNPYQPHITLGYDFSIETFKKLKENFSKREFLRGAIIDNLCLADKNKEGKWTSFKKFNL
jgi:2'-5' RNA ligase